MAEYCSNVLPRTWIVNGNVQFVFTTPCHDIVGFDLRSKSTVLGSAVGDFHAARHDGWVSISWSEWLEGSEVPSLLLPSDDSSHFESGRSVATRDRHFSPYDSTIPRRRRTPCRWQSFWRRERGSRLHMRFGSTVSRARGSNKVGGRGRKKTKGEVFGQ